MLMEIATCGVAGVPTCASINTVAQQRAEPRRATDTLFTVSAADVTVSCLVPDPRH
jgi:hypothetical protein